MMNGKYYLILTIIIETLAVSFIKLSNGAANKVYFSAGLLSFFISFLLLSQAFKTLEIGLANAIWAGSSTVLVYLVGIYFFKESFNWQQLLFIALIIIGIVGLNFNSKA
ncbi:MAG: multidrug efflux SMR transporter [Chitinophagaceae bacterium]|nr:multidrug efflux SMR transporter [Chitinophagaceae bacterium]